MSKAFKYRKSYSSASSIIKRLFDKVKYDKLMEVIFIQKISTEKEIGHLQLSFYPTIARAKAALFGQMRWNFAVAHN